MAGLTSPEGALDELKPVTLCGPGTWVMMEGYLKPFAAVRHAHYGAQAALDLRPGIEGRIRDISAIELSIYAEALTYCGNRAPTKPIQAQFSLSYAIAAALKLGDLGPEAYRDVSDATLTKEEIKLLLDAKGKWVRLENKGWRKLEFKLTEEEDKELARLGLTVSSGATMRSVFSSKDWRVSNTADTTQPVSP